MHNVCLYPLCQEIPDSLSKSKNTAMAKPVNENGVSIIDIRQGEHEASLLRDIMEKLSSYQEPERTLPSMLLYDAEGLRLFEEITYLDEYYLTNAEIEVLEKHAQQIANMICSGSLIVELGSGYEPALIVENITNPDVWCWRHLEAAPERGGTDLKLEICER